MDTINTYRALLTGTIILFAGCILWLVISRETITTLNRQSDQLRLNQEAMLSEKLLLEKSLEKESVAQSELEDQVDSLSDAMMSLQHNYASAQEHSRGLRLQLGQSKGREHELQNKLDAASEETARQEEWNMMIQITNRLKADSISLLLDQMGHLREALTRAETHTIDGTLLVAQKRNGKLTTKTKRVDKIIARVNLPVNLQNLTYQLAMPNGTLIDDGNSLIAREVSEPFLLSASLQPISPVAGVRTVELIYHPTSKLSAGRYDIKIQNNDTYVGTMAIMLER